MKTRNTTNLVPGITPIQFEEAMAKYAAAEKRETEINKNIETKVSDMLELYAGELSVLAQLKKRAFEIAHSFCVQNKERLFRTRRSIGTLHGIAGFRLGTPKLKPAKGADWKGILAVLKEKLPDYVRTTEEPARDMLLAHRHKERVAPMLVETGLHIVQDELFYIDTKKAA
ncbi:MAG: host-nuclease inhibitor Gam family protein [Bacteroidota bacterium]